MYIRDFPAFWSRTYAETVVIEVFSGLSRQHDSKQTWLPDWALFWNAELVGQQRNVFSASYTVVPEYFKQDLDAFS